MTEAVNGTRAVFSNGRILLLVILVLALVSVTVLGALHDIDSESLVAIFSAIVGGAVGHANGNLQGRLAAERERLLAQKGSNPTDAG